MLKCVKLSKHFGHLRAVDGLDIEVKEGQIVGIVGPNGAGKTTLFNLISGLLQPTSGEIKFRGLSIEHLNLHEVCHLGIARTFQIPAFFASKSIFENVLVGATFGKKARSPDKEFVQGLLEFVGLTRGKQEPTAGLPTIDMKRLMMATALATEPKLLLLDEPTAGLNPTEIEEITKIIKRVNHQGITIVVIEHDVKMITGLCDRIIVLDKGSKIYEGPPLEASEDEGVREVYLGR